jgi:hypothetical protein
MSDPKPSRIDVLTEPVETALVVQHLAGSVGLEKARALVEDAFRWIGVPYASWLDPGTCSRMLERMSLQPGLVGIAARVTKLKLQLKMGPK